MTQALDYRELGDMIHHIFTHLADYRVDKHVPAFTVHDKFIGDFFTYVMLELQGDEPPIFYHKYSPYDVISSKAPGYGAVMQAGKLLFHEEITSYIAQRTGVMSSVVLQGLGVQSLSDKKVLLVGAGTNAQCALAALKQHYPELTAVEFVTRESDGQPLQTLAETLGVKLTRGDLAQIEQYDVIICHTNSKEPVLTADMQPRIKPGAFISAFASEDFVEIAEEFYDGTTANIIVDWDQTTSEAVELKAALDHGRANQADLLRLADLLAGAVKPDPHKTYTLYRSHGTPMQDLASLKLLMSRSSTRE